jgi:TPR repeat protein
VALGGALASGEELPRDVPAARALVQPLCERDGEPEACFYLGLTFHRASPPRYPEAAAAYEKACARQELSACLNLALILPRSGATGAVATRVRALLEQACPALPRACSELALRLSEGQPADVTRALELARQACEAKEGLACFVAGKLVGAGRGAPRDDDLARIFLEHACHLGEYRGCTAAGLLWRDGVGMPADPARAVGFFEKGCASGEPEACFPLALCLRDGLGVTKDAARARGLLEAGCRAGYRPACGELP